LILWWLIAIPTIREYNSYLQDSKPVKKVGAFCWLSLAICIVELLICMKFGHGELPLFNFLVRYSIDNPVCDNEFSWKKNYVLQTVCLTFSKFEQGCFMTQCLPGWLSFGAQWGLRL
jgi:hypothetical protein